MFFWLLFNRHVQGILQGEAIPDIAKRLQRVANMDYNTAVRSARTATTAAECAGRTHVYKKAEAMGIEMEQEWLATLDGRTRHAHRQLDGQRVPVGQPFQVDGYEIEYPGDPKAPGYLIYNCRCTTVAAVKGVADTVKHRSSMMDMTYDEWKNYHTEEAENTRKVQTTQLKNEKNRGILKEKISSGEFPLTIHQGRQRKHIVGTNEYKTYLNRRIENGKTPQSILDISEEDAKRIVERYCASGVVEVKLGKDGNTRIVEYTTTDTIVGRYFDNGGYRNTHRVQIHYSKKGEHIVPVMEDYNG